MTITDWFKIRRKPTTAEARGPYDDLGEIETLEGTYEIDEEYIKEHGGYYIIRGVEGEKYPCAKNIFHKIYEKVDSDETRDSIMCKICGCNLVKEAREMLRCAECQTILAVKIVPVDEIRDENDEKVNNAIYTIPNHVAHKHLGHKQ